MRMIILCSVSKLPSFSCSHLLSSLDSFFTLVNIEVFTNMLVPVRNQYVGLSAFVGECFVRAVYLV